MAKFAACVLTSSLKKDHSKVIELPLVLVDREVVDSVVFGPHPDFLQVIPYIQVIDSETDEILSYRRGDAGDESRLQGRRSVGFGGHIDTVHHSSTITTIVEEASRELEEELGIAQNARIKRDLDLALNAREFRTIYITGTPVDEAHLGLCLSVKVKREDVTAFEKGTIVDAQWYSTNQLKQQLMDSPDLYENWSKVVIHNL